MSSAPWKDTDGVDVSVVFDEISDPVMLIEQDAHMVAVMRRSVCQPEETGADPERGRRCFGLSAPPHQDCRRRCTRRYSLSSVGFPRSSLFPPCAMRCPFPHFDDGCVCIESARPRSP